METNLMREFYRKNFKLWWLIPLLIFPLAFNAQTKSASIIPTNRIDTAQPITLDEAIKFATQQASDFRQAQLNEKIVKEDIIRFTVRKYAIESPTRFSLLNIEQTTS